MQVVLLAIRFAVCCAFTAGAMFVGIYIYRTGYNDGSCGNVKSALLPQIPKKPRLSRAQAEKIEELQQQRNEGFNNIVKYMNGED